MAAASGSSAEPHCTSAYSSYLWWHMVYQKKLLGLTSRWKSECRCLYSQQSSKQVLPKGRCRWASKKWEAYSIDSIWWVCDTLNKAFYLSVRESGWHEAGHWYWGGWSYCMQVFEKEQLLKGKTATSSTTAKCRAMIQVHIRLLCL